MKGFSSWERREAAGSGAGAWMWCLEDVRAVSGVGRGTVTMGKATPSTGDHHRAASGEPHGVISAVFTHGQA